MIYTFGPSGSIQIYLTLLVNGTSIKSIPLFEWIIRGITLIECFPILLLFITYPFFLRILFNSAVFHQNLMMIFSLNAFHFLAQGVSRFFLLLYQYEIFEFTDVPNSATMLLVFCTIRMYAVSFTVIAIFPIFLERCFATLFVQDYEKEKRTYIFFGIILFLMLFCSICPFVILIGIAMERTTTLYIVTPCYMIAHITHHLAHQLLKKYNQQIVAQISEHPLEGRQYTLATRFQLKENLRALDLLHRMLSVSTIVNVYYGTFIVITFTFFDSEAPGAQILMAMIELMLAWYPIMFLLLALHTVEEWLIKFKRNLDFLFHFTSLEKIVKINRIEPHIQTKMYFEIYRQSW